MKAQKNLRVIAVVALSAVVVFALFGCDIEEVIDGAIGNIEAVREETAFFELTGLADLDVDTSNGYVIVESHEAENVLVTAKLRSRGNSLEEAEERVNAIVIHMNQVGNNIELIYRGSEQSSEVRRSSGVSFEVAVPVQADVEVDTSNGEITVRGIEGEFNLDTSNGAVTLSDLVGVLNVDTSNGRIDVRGFNGVLDIETSNGAIDISESSASISARTSNGRIDFSGELVGDSHSLRTSNGAITARVQLDASVTIDASTSIGSISSNLALTGDTEGRDWNAVLNAPATQTLKLRTSNGSIRIEGI